MRNETIEQNLTSGEAGHRREDQPHALRLRNGKDVVRGGAAGWRTPIDTQSASEGSRGASLKPTSLANEGKNAQGLTPTPERHDGYPAQGAKPRFQPKAHVAHVAGRGDTVSPMGWRGDGVGQTTLGRGQEDAERAVKTQQREPRQSRQSRQQGVSPSVRMPREERNACGAMSQDWPMALGKSAGGEDAHRFPVRPPRSGWVQRLAAVNERLTKRLDEALSAGAVNGVTPEGGKVSGSLRGRKAGRVMGWRQHAHTCARPATGRDDRDASEEGDIGTEPVAESNAGGDDVSHPRERGFALTSLVALRRTLDALCPEGESVPAMESEGEAQEGTAKGEPRVVNRPQPNGADRAQRANPTNPVGALRDALTFTPERLYAQDGREAAILFPLASDVVLAREATTIERLRVAVGNDTVFKTHLLPVLASWATYVQGLGRVTLTRSAWGEQEDGNPNRFGVEGGLFKASVAYALEAMILMNHGVVGIGLADSERTAWEERLQVAVLIAALLSDASLLDAYAIEAVALAPTGLRAKTNDGWGDSAAGTATGLGAQVAQWVDTRDARITRVLESRLQGEGVTEQTDSVGRSAAREATWRREKRTRVQVAAALLPVETATQDAVQPIARVVERWDPHVETLLTFGRRHASALLKKEPGAGAPERSPGLGFRVTVKREGGDPSRSTLPLVLLRQTVLPATRLWLAGLTREGMPSLVALLEGALMNRTPMVEGDALAREASTTLLEVVTLARSRVEDQRERLLAKRQGRQAQLTGWADVLALAIRMRCETGDWIPNGTLLGVKIDPAIFHQAHHTMARWRGEAEVTPLSSARETSVAKMATPLLVAEDGVFLQWPEALSVLVPHLRQLGIKRLNEDTRVLAEMLRSGGWVIPTPAGETVWVVGKTGREGGTVNGALPEDLTTRVDRMEAWERLAKGSGSGEGQEGPVSEALARSRNLSPLPMTEGPGAMATAMAKAGMERGQDAGRSVAPLGAGTTEALGGPTTAPDRGYLKWRDADALIRAAERFALRAGMTPPTPLPALFPEVMAMVSAYESLGRRVTVKEERITRGHEGTEPGREGGSPRCGEPWITGAEDDWRGDATEREREFAAERWALRATQERVAEEALWRSLASEGEQETEALEVTAKHPTDSAPSVRVGGSEVAGERTDACGQAKHEAKNEAKNEATMGRDREGDLGKETPVETDVNKGGNQAVKKVVTKGGEKAMAKAMATVEANAPTPGTRADSRSSPEECEDAALENASHTSIARQTREAAMTQKGESAPNEAKGPPPFFATPRTWRWVMANDGIAHAERDVTGVSGATRETKGALQAMQHGSTQAPEGNAQAGSTEVSDHSLTEPPLRDGDAWDARIEGALRTWLPTTLRRLNQLTPWPEAFALSQGVFIPATLLPENIEILIRDLDIEGGARALVWRAVGEGLLTLREARMSPWWAMRWSEAGLTRVLTEHAGCDKDASHGQYPEPNPWTGGMASYGWGRVSPYSRNGEAVRGHAQTFSSLPALRQSLRAVWPGLCLRARDASETEECEAGGCGERGDRGAREDYVSPPVMGLVVAKRWVRLVPKATLPSVREAECEEVSPSRTNAVRGEVSDHYPQSFLMVALGEKGDG